MSSSSSTSHMFKKISDEKKETPSYPVSLYYYPAKNVYHPGHSAIKVGNWYFSLVGNGAADETNDRRTYHEPVIIQMRNTTKDPYQLYTEWEKNLNYNLLSNNCADSALRILEEVSPSCKEKKLVSLEAINIPRDLAKNVLPISMAEIKEDREKVLQTPASGKKMLELICLGERRIENEESEDKLRGDGVDFEWINKKNEMKIELNNLKQDLLNDSKTFNELKRLYVGGSKKFKFKSDSWIKKFDASWMQEFEEFATCFSACQKEDLNQFRIKNQADIIVADLTKKVDGIAINVQNYLNFNLLSTSFDMRDKIRIDVKQIVDEKKSYKDKKQKILDYQKKITQLITNLGNIAKNKQSSKDLKTPIKEVYNKYHQNLEQLRIVMNGLILMKKEKNSLEAESKEKIGEIQKYTLENELETPAPGEENDFFAQPPTRSRHGHV